MGAGEEAAVLGRPPLVAVLNRLPTATEGGTVFGSQGKPRTARFLLLCSALASEALNGISHLTKSLYARNRHYVRHDSHV